MLDAHAPWWSRTPIFGNLGAPIIRKEVTALVRRNRWFWAQFIYLVVVIAGMMIIYFVEATSESPVEEIGASLVGGFFTLQLGLVFLIFPGLAATSISSERVEKSFDLLAVSDLSPAEIVWGKLIGILGSAGYFIGSTLPVLGVCIFFGGLSPLSIAIDYAFLFVVALVLTSWGILVSSFTKGNITAIIITYALALIVGAFVVQGYAQIQQVTGAPGIREMLEQMPPRARGPVLAVAGGVVSAFVGGCLVGAVFSLSPPESNRVSAFRVYAAALLAALVSWLAWVSASGASRAITGSAELPAEGGMIHSWILGMAMFVVLVAFAGSRVETPLAAVRGAALRPLRTRLLWPILGGGVRGWVCAATMLALASGALLAAHLAAVELYVDHGGSAKLEWRYFPLHAWYPWLAEVFAAWIFAHLGLAFLLAATGIRGAQNFVLSAGAAILLVLWSASSIAQHTPARRGDRAAAEVQERPLIVSPLLVMDVRGSAKDATGPRRHPATTGHWVAGILLLGAGLVVLRVRGLPALRLARPGYEFLSNPRGLPELPLPLEGSGEAEGAAPG